MRDSGCLRDVVGRIEPWLGCEEVLILQGLRHSGKTTVLYQLMDALERQGVEEKAMLHLNFEDPRLVPWLTTQGLEQGYQCYRREVCPSGKVYLFFDEIQLVQGWERWVRSVCDREDVQVILTGSSSALLSRELGSSLTGRHVSFRINPLSFSELLRFYQVEEPKGPWPWEPPPTVGHLLSRARSWGSLPKVHRLEHDEQRQHLLRQYLTDILYHDVAVRHPVRDVPTLRHLAVHLLTHTASFSQVTRLARQLAISPTLVRQYTEYLQETYLLDLLPIFTLKVGERQRHPQKIHALDAGLRHVACLSTSQDHGRLLESQVLGAIHHAGHFHIYYGKIDGHEVDFVLHQGSDVTHLIQVVLGGDPHVVKRETRSLQALSKRYPGARCLVVTEDPYAQTLASEFSDWDWVPAWQWMLRPQRWLAT